ncbi:hypothetical protein TELCIR_20849, partial [Teladorsagia circumcincta]
MSDKYSNDEELQIAIYYVLSLQIVYSLPIVDCMEDRLRLTFKTQLPFHGRIFVKGMSTKDTCMKNFITSSSPPVTFELRNGDCNMRRTRM